MAMAVTKSRFLDAVHAMARHKMHAGRMVGAKTAEVMNRAATNSDRTIVAAKAVAMKVVMATIVEPQQAVATNVAAHRFPVANPEAMANAHAIMAQSHQALVATRML